MVNVLVGLEQAVLFCPPEYAGHVEVQSGTPAVRRWPSRVCDGFEISLLLGPAHAAVIQGRPTTTPGNVTFVQLPGTVWSAEQVHGAFLSIEIGPELFENLLEEWPSSRLLPPPSQIVIPELLRTFSRAHNAFRLQNDATSRTEAMVDLIHQVLTTLTGLEPKISISDSISRARDALHADPVRAPTIDELAGETGLSQFEFVRAFHHRYGIGPAAYRRALKLARARHLLRRGYTVDEVVTEIGFSSTSALTRAFIGLIGLEPTRYAEQVTGRSYLEPGSN